MEIWPDPRLVMMEGMKKALKADQEGFPSVGLAGVYGWCKKRAAGPDGRPAGGRFPYNPNGSVDDIAGICDQTGRVFGLLPHPEAYSHPVNHPSFTRLKEEALRSGKAPDTAETPGIRLFRNGVDYIRKNIL